MNVVVSAIVDPWVTTLSFVVALAMKIQAAKPTKAALFCAPGLKADANTLQNHNHPHMNYLPFLGHKKWEAVLRHLAFKILDDQCSWFLTRIKLQENSLVAVFLLLNT